MIEPLPRDPGTYVQAHDIQAADMMNARTVTPTPRASHNAITLLLVAGCLSACGGSGGGGTSSAPPLPPPSTFDPTFSDIQASIFTISCATSGCHSGAGAPQGLQLDAANSFANLVGVTSNEDANFLRVAPGDPDNSYLIQKLEGTASVGGQMPLGGTPLDQGVIDIVRQWISDGAIDDRMQASDPIRVASITPLPGSDLSSAPTQIIAGFDRDPDASTVNANTFLLESSGGDGTFGDGNEIQIMATSITVPAANTRSAVFEPANALADETYRVRLLGTGASVILDMDANALDGEFGSSFPSGNGTEGGDFEAQFSITTPPPAGTTLDEIQAAVFSVSCSNAGCHSGPTSNSLPSGMDLTSADDSFANLVNIASLEVGSLMRVQPGDPDNSYLIQKLEGTAASGGQMPLGGAPLDQATIDNIRAWIANGAVR